MQFRAWVGLFVSTCVWNNVSSMFLILIPIPLLSSLSSSRNNEAVRVIGNCITRVSAPCPSFHIQPACRRADHLISCPPHVLVAVFLPLPSAMKVLPCSQKTLKLKNGCGDCNLIRVKQFRQRDGSKCRPEDVSAERK